MYLSLRLGIPLKETLKISFEEFLLWQEYFKEERNIPDRTDHYLMQIALILANKDSKEKIKDLDKMKIVFGKSKKIKIKHTPESIQATKNRWRQAAGCDPISLPPIELSPIALSQE